VYFVTLTSLITEDSCQEKRMIKSKVRSISAKFMLLVGVVVMVMSALLLAAPKPAAAGTDFSIGLNIGGSQIVYRNWSGGGYRYWHGAYWDHDHHWHDGYYYGPVVYSAPVDSYYWTNGAPHYYHHFGGVYGGYNHYNDGGGYNHYNNDGGGYNHYNGGWGHNDDDNGHSNGGAWAQHGGGPGHFNGGSGWHNHN
jgi:hypothetical protein